MASPAHQRDHTPVARLEVDGRGARIQWRLDGVLFESGDGLEVLLGAGGWLRGAFAHDGQAGSPPRLVVPLGALEPVSGALSLPWQAELRWASGGRRAPRDAEFQPLLVVQDQLRSGARVEVLLGCGVIVRGRMRLAGERVVLVPALALGPASLVRVPGNRA